MPPAHGYLRGLLRNLTRIRENAGLTQEQVEERLILGSGWIARFENGSVVPSVDMLLAILSETKGTLADLTEGLPKLDAAEVERCIYAEQAGKDVIVRFRYTSFDSQYLLPDSTLEEYETIIKELRSGLASLRDADSAGEGEQARAIKSDTVARTFLKAVRLWPHVNPSDLWWFIIYRAYCDPYNHPARFAGSNLTEGWKRTGGWALEKVLVLHYGPYLQSHGVNMFIAPSTLKRELIASLQLEGRIEADKIDVVLTGDTPEGSRFFGVVHVKASFAERRTDDVPLSDVLSQSRYTSPLLTMDCKSTPGPRPVNRGELGGIQGRRSAKRMDIEQEGYFTGCFSYNRNTIPSPEDLPPERRVTVCDFSGPDDAFSKFILKRWSDFQEGATMVQSFP